MPTSARGTSERSANPVAHMLKHGCRGRTHGFSLIEILVVIVVIGIALALAVPSLFPDERETLRRESERVTAILEAMRDEAALGGRAVSLRIKDNRLEFLERDPHAVQPTWQSASIEGLKPGPLPEGMALTIDADGANTRDTVTFLPVGVVQPFLMRLRAGAGQGIIRGDAIGNISLVLENAAR